MKWTPATNAAAKGSLARLFYVTDFVVRPD